MRVNKDFSDKKFQEDFVAELRNYKWESPDRLNGNKHRVTVNNLIDHWRSELNRINREARASERELNDNVQERILSLSDEEIDHLVYEKWFGEIVQSKVDLTEQPLMDDIETLKMLDERYSETLDDLDNEINELHKAF